MRLACNSLLLGLSVWGRAHAAISPAEYDAAIAEARSGKAAAAIGKLRAWHAAYPGERRIVFDLAAILDTSGDHEGALKFRRQILAGDAPPYALKAVAHAARVSGHLQEAEEAYRRLLGKAPDDADAHAGLAYVWMAQGKAQEAMNHIVARLPKSADQYKQADLPLVVTLAELHEKGGAWLDAAAAYQQALRLDPGFRYALRGQALALLNAGLPFLAQRLALRHPEAFSEEEKFRFAQAVNAHAMRFGQAQQSADEDGSGNRYATTDIALEGNAELARVQDLRVQFDRLVALRDRSRMEEAVKLYESLLARKINVPAYARFAVADAYLYLQQPEIARDLYLDGLKNTAAVEADEQLTAKLALVYAYLEAEQYEQARDLADELLTTTPKRLFRDVRGLDSPNPDYARVYLTRALIDLYGEQPEEAEWRLSDMRSRAPFNAEVRAAWASLQAAREHPRTALEEFNLLLADAPKSRDAALGRAELLLALHQLTQARPEVARLQTAYPESRAVQNLQARLKNYEAPFLRVETVIGRGGVAAGADSVYDAALYSSPLTNSLGDRFRVFTHLARADGGDVGVTRSRAGVGLDYRSPDVLAEAEVNRTIDGFSRSGVALSLSWNLSDQWQARAALDTNMIDLPAQALLASLDGKSLKASLQWTQNESRQAGGELSTLRFSDGNVRNAAQVWWRERLISRPVFKLDALIAASTSTNDTSGRAYFNPERDQELSVGLKAEWLTWRRYQRSFKQGLGVKWGQYRQSGFAGGAVADLHYEHDWNLDNVAGLKYGVGRSFHPYDGVRDYRSYAYLNLYWHIQ